MTCKIVGPYHPVGDTDWRCATHGVDAVLREGAEPHQFGRRQDMVCPIAQDKKESPVMNKSRALKQAEETLRAAEMTAARAAQRIVDLSNRPEEPTTDDPDGALVLWFKRKFAEEVRSTSYTYSAVKSGKYWYLTGARAPQAITWDALLDWLDDGLVGSIWVAGEWTEVQ